MDKTKHRLLQYLGASVGLLLVLGVDTIRECVARLARTCQREFPAIASWQTELMPTPPLPA